MSRKQNSGSSIRHFPASSLLGQWTLNIGHWMLSPLFPLRDASGMLLAALLLALLAPLCASAQFGPFPVFTRQASFEAEIVKRDKDVLWVRRKASDGRYMPQIGIAVSDVVGIRMPRPPAFDGIERVRANPASSETHFKAAHAALDRIIAQTRSLRDIPGVPAEEAIVLKGRLFDRQNLPREAVRQYENVLANAKPSSFVTNAQILAGIAYAKLGEFQFAVEYLHGMPPLEEDEEILSAQLFALGDSYLALGNVDQALLSYLSLVVFHPFVQNNEPRALAAALACYAKLGEWEPLYRNVQEIQKHYPNTPAAKTAEEFLAKYKDELANAGQFVDAAKITSADVPSPAPATSTSTNAPSNAP